MQKDRGCQRIRGRLVMSTCDFCFKTDWDGIHCGVRKVCTSCLNSILEKQFERENNERTRTEH